MQTKRLPRPAPDNQFLKAHVELLLRSYRHWTGRDLLDPALPLETQAEQLFLAPFVVASHDGADDPVLNYGNQAALDLWEADWETLTSMPSRKTAEPERREERSRLLQRVTTNGYIDDYTGVRISTKGRRFRIERATVWNVIDGQGAYRGQAVVFRHWTPL